MAPRVLAGAAFPLGAALWFSIVSAFSACGDDRERIHPTREDAAETREAGEVEAAFAEVDLGPSTDSAREAEAGEAFEDRDAGPDETDADDSMAADAADGDLAASEACVPDGAGADLGIEGAVGGACNCPPLSVKTVSVDACGITVSEWVSEGAGHYDPSTPIVWCTKPPSSGPHFGAWASFRTYDKPVAYGWLVHSLEHGAALIVYKCASSSACPAVAAELQRIVDARPVDPACIDPDGGDVAAEPKRRIILLPDPDLDVPVAASTWGWTYRAGCLDRPSLDAFLDGHYGKGAPEDYCFDGIVPP